MIRIHHLQKKFGKNQVLRDISLELSQPGRISAILGPNGSGKTTLIKSILGMVIPDSGEVLVDGSSIKKKWAYRSQIDYLPQIARFPENLRVSELIRMIKDIHGGEAHEEVLIRRFGLAPFLDKRLRHLSGGTKQKVNLTLALMYDSPILILDEPTSGLDPVALIQLKEIIREERSRGKLILITTHIMSFVEEMADEIIFLLDGRIHFRGSKNELKHRYAEDTIEKAIAELLRKKAPQQRELSLSGRGVAAFRKAFSFGFITQNQRSC